MVPLSMTLMDC